MTGTQFAKHVNIAGAAPSEPVVVADDELTNTATLQEHPFYELRGTERGQRWREWQNDRVIKTTFGNRLELFLGGAEKRRSCRRLDYLEGVRIEGDEKTREPKFRRALSDTAQEIAMPTMNPIECPDSEHGA
jgi:hypothetical protein